MVKVGEGSGSKRVVSTCPTIGIRTVISPAVVQMVFG